MSEKKVKLVFYQRVNNEIVIDNIPATEWDDFLVVHIRASSHWNEQEPFVQAFKDYADKTGKEVLLIPEDWDIQFYGIEVEDEEPE